MNFVSETIKNHYIHLISVSNSKRRLAKLLMECKSWFIYSEIKDLIKGQTYEIEQRADHNTRNI